MCDAMQPIEEQACRLLEAHGQYLGFHYGFEEATARAGALILNGEDKAA